MKSFLSFGVRPYGIFILTTLSSFLMWLFPGFNGQLRKGFNDLFPVSSSGLLVCSIWFIAIVIFSYIGFTLGKKLKINTEIIDKKASINDLRPYLMLSTFSYIGILAVMVKILGEIGISGIISSFSGGQANTLKDTLYDSYSIGIVSLRYMAIPACALAIFNIFRRKYFLLNMLNIICLIVVASISSRLSIIFTVFTFLPLLIYKLKIKVTPFKALIAAIVIFHLLAALNYSRNINFYRRIGIDNFYLAGFSEILTYVGSPFQGFLAAGTIGDRFIGTSQVEVARLTGISIELSTNSAFLEIVRSLGVLQSFLAISMCALIGSIIIGISFKNRNNLLILLVGTIGYCFAEIWRVFLFGQGIVYTIVLLVIGVTAWCIYIPRISFLKIRGKKRDYEKYNI